MPDLDHSINNLRPKQCGALIKLNRKAQCSFCNQNIFPQGIKNLKFKEYIIARNSSPTPTNNYMALHSNDIDTSGS